MVIQALGWAIDRWQSRSSTCRWASRSKAPAIAPAQLSRAIEDAYFKDVQVFAAAHNDHPLTRSYPALFAPPMLSVNKGLFDDPLLFRIIARKHIEFLAHGRGYLGPFANEPATSWAAPHLRGIAARLLSLRPGLKPFEVKTLLYWMFQSGEQGASRPCSRPK